MFSTLLVILTSDPPGLPPLDGMSSEARLEAVRIRVRPGRDGRRQTKERPVAPILPVELVVTILTPPGPCRSSNMPASSVQSS